MVLMYICLYLGKKYYYIQEENIIEVLNNCYLWLRVNVVFKFIFTLFFLVQTGTLTLFST